MKKYFILAAVAATFAACSFDKDLGESASQITQPQDEIVPIALASSFNIPQSSTVTRSTSTSVQDTELGSPIGVYIYKTGKLKADGGYGFANINYNTPTVINSNYYSLSTSSSVVFPEAKTQKVDVFSYAPYLNPTDTPAPTEGITSIANYQQLNDDTNAAIVNYTTVADQSSESNYKKADLLYGFNKNTSTAKDNSVTYDVCATKAKSHKDDTDNTVNADGFFNGRIYLPMVHKLSKITLKITPNGMDVDKLEEATVKIHADKMGGTLALDDGTWTTTTNATDATNGDPITLTSKLGYKNDNTTKYTTSDTSGDGVIHDNTNITGYTACGIIVPQAFPTTHPFLTITLSDATTSYSWKETTLTTLTFESGKEYIFNITVKASGLTVAVQVQDWESTSDNNGNAVLD